MDFSRISGVIDVGAVESAEVTVVGAGGSADLIVALARCGIGVFNLIDPDTVTATNIARQGQHADEIGQLKVEAVATAVRRVNPDARVGCLPRDFLEMTDEEIDDKLGHTNLFIFSTDRFAAQARGNEVALRLNRAAIWTGVYVAGGAGEVIWWAPGVVDACYRCLLSKRYEAHAKAAGAGGSLDPASQGTTIFDVSLTDSIAGMLAIGLLTRGADNRFGRLIDQLGNRNFLQVQLDPAWSLNGRNPIREHLGVAADCPAFFSWNTIVRADPQDGQPPCPDCEKYRGRKVEPATQARAKAS